MRSITDLIRSGALPVALAVAACGGGDSSGGGGAGATTTVASTVDHACPYCNCTCGGVSVNFYGSYASGDACTQLSGTVCALPVDAGMTDGGDDAGSDGGVPIYENCTSYVEFPSCPQ